MADIKTGNKGFINPADGNKVYTMDSVPPGSPGSNEAPPDYDPGNMSVDNSVRDISTKTRVTLGTYLSKVTKGEIGSTTKPNTYTVDPSTPASLPSTITTQGFPTPLGPSDNSSQFKQVLPSSFSQDFPAVKDDFKKGKSPAAVPDGNTLLPTATSNDQSTQLATGPIKKYTTEATAPNHWSTGGVGFSGGEDILQPSSGFDVPLQSTAVAGLPSVVVSTSAQYELDLTAKVGKPTIDTTDNSYPVSPGTPDGSPNIVAITSPDGKYPAPLTPPTNQNPNVHSPNLPPVTTDFYPPVADDIKKGKRSAPDTAIDGHSLLGDSIQTDPQGVTVLNPPLNEYTESILDSNNLNPGNPTTDPEVDISKPPADYFKPLPDVNEKGKSDSVDKNTIYLNETPSFLSSDVSLRKIPGRLTEKQNDFPVDAVITRSLFATTDVQTGDPTPLGQVADINSNYYTKDNVNAEKGLRQSNSVPDLSRGKGNNPYNGNNLLLTVNGDISTGLAEDKINVHDEKLGKTNFVALSRGSKLQSYTPENHPVSKYEGQRGRTILGAGNNRFAATFATDSVDSTFNPTLTLSDGTKVSSLKLAKIGTGLSQRASAEIPAWTSGDFDPTGAISDLGAVLPSVAQLGILKVNNQLLSARDVLNSITSADDLPGDALTEIALFGGQSWGSMTNVSEAFDDPGSSVGLFLTLLAVLIAITLLYGFIALIIQPSERVKTNDGGRYVLGSYNFKSPTDSLFSFPDASEIFGIKPTAFAFDEALLAGFSSFFLGSTNLKTSAFGIVIALLASAVNALGDATFSDNSSLGANLVVCRSIVRSGLVFAEYISNIVKKFQVSVVAGLASILGILRVFRSSKFIASLNVFASIGDTLLATNNTLVQITDPAGKPLSLPLLEKEDPSKMIHSTVKKSRLDYLKAGDNGSYSTEYNKTLAWSSKRAPSLNLLPMSVSFLQMADADNKLGSFKGIQALDHTFAKTYAIPTTTSRLKTDEVNKFEKLLEAEYVPFYFHDVRTNEIISFHAFLASLQDDFTASYDSIEGFGRVEPVKIYKGTTRKIALSFYIASTSESDFDHMWYKINKLTTMVYPQYTSGRRLVGQNYDFTAPFSQLVGASPLIRLRLGELFRSNYSRFALARLFGLNESATIEKDGSGTRLAGVNSSTEIQEKHKQLEKRKKTYKVGDKFTLTRQDLLSSGRIRGPVEKLIYAGSRSVQLADARSLANSDSIVSNLDITDFFATLSASNLPDIGDADNFLVEAIEDAVGGRIKVKTKLDLSQDAFQSLAVVLGLGNYLELTKDIVFSIPIKYLTRTKEDEKKILEEIKIPKESKESYASIDDFMSEDKNSIVKSFESAGGKGLAGFIESMGFDWYDRVPWEVSPGKSAPKMCKVTISFSPIHDITPGLDHNGYNRAPIYPVGNAMRSTAVKTNKNK